MFEDLTQYNLLTQIFIVFTAGIGTSLTPCVYPLIPITLTLFGADDDCRRTRSFLLSLTFVAGISVTFTLLGIISATTGSLFGSVLSHPVIIITLAALLALLACTSLDLFQIPFLCSLQSRACNVGAKGYIGAFFAGTAAGVVASPCVGPVLVAILILVAKSGDIFTGAVLLLSFSIGLGLLFVILGTFSGLLQRIPRSGHWMSGVKFFMGTALLFVAWFILQPLLDLSSEASLIEAYHLLVWGVLSLAAIVAVLSYRFEQRVLRFSASAIIATGLFLIYVEKTPVETPVATPESIVWHSTFAQALETAKKEKKPVFIDLYADWCVACKKLDETTLKDKEVQKLLAPYVLAKVDFTVDNDETIAMTEKYGIVGLPWLFATDSSGELIEDSVITGYVDAEEFIEKISKVKATQP